jgi:hypothetical protein
LTGIFIPEDSLLKGLTIASFSSSLPSVIVSFGDIYPSDPYQRTFLPYCSRVFYSGCILNALSFYFAFCKNLENLSETFGFLSAALFEV